MTPFPHDRPRLYALRWLEQGPDFEVEAWWGREALSEGFELTLDVLSHDARLPLEPMLGQVLTLETVLADGSRSERSGLVREARSVGSDGGWCRYRLTVVPWTWLLTRGRHNRVFQDKTVPEILAAVFAAYDALAAWHWSEDVEAFLADVRPRSYCVQYRESDYAFMSRLLAEEGLGWCIEEHADAPSRHRMRLFADSTRFPEDPLSVNAPRGHGLRFHRADSQEAQDSIVALGAEHRLAPTRGAVLGFDYRAKRAIGGSIPRARRSGSGVLPALELRDYAGQYAHASVREAERYQRLAMEALEARAATFVGRGTVRSLRPGSFITLEGLPSRLASPSASELPRFAITAVTHAGINNLDAARIDAVAGRLARLADPEDAHGHAAENGPAPAVLPPALVELARIRGYGNAFDASRADTPWRPMLADGTGARFNPRPTAPGPMSALVVGPEGEIVAKGADELWCDALGRIKVRFHWQEGEASDDRSSCWLRVASRQAGAGMGWQWLPRIGQEVLVDFLGGDIDRPVVLGALYNGRGEGGVPPTPGGRIDQEADSSVFDAASDQRPAGQGNLVAQHSGGNSPAWHGAAAASHHHPGALSGFKSTELGASGAEAGYNQLVFDDSDRELRVQLKTTQHASELNLGHLVHQAGNYRGSFRGRGAELRTDAWGALRAGRGTVMSTWPQTDAAEPAGEFAQGLALLEQACMLADTLSRAAQRHHTVPLAAAQGSASPDASAGDPEHPPLEALKAIAAGRVSAREFGSGGDTVPQLAAPAILQAAQAGIGLVAGRSLQLAADDTATLMSGEDTNLAIAGTARLHAGHAIGLLAAAHHPGPASQGLRLIAAEGDLNFQAQSDELQFTAKEELKLVSVGAHIDFAAAKKIVLSVEGGASITIDGGITVACPGTITVHASRKSFGGPTRKQYPLPQMPDSTNPAKHTLRFALSSSDALANDMGLVGKPYQISNLNGDLIAQGKIDTTGRLPRIETDSSSALLLRIGANEWETVESRSENGFFEASGLENEAGTPFITNRYYESLDDSPHQFLDTDFVMSLIENPE